VYTVVLSEHARQRLIERAGTDKGARAEIARRLTSALRIGTVPGPDLGVTVHLPDRYKAICYPTYEGTWVVVTILEPEMEVKDAMARHEEAAAWQ
jgi:hypothetical protein